jgi:hypothetical protein
MATTPAILCDNYDDFEKLNVLGAYMFTHNAQGEITGIINKCAGCGAMQPINLDPAAGRPLWTLECINPITIMPSIIHVCGWHGWLKNGEWVSC